MLLARLVEFIYDEKIDRLQGCEVSEGALLRKDEYVLGAEPRVWSCYNRVVFETSNSRLRVSSISAIVGTMITTVVRVLRGNECVNDKAFPETRWGAYRDTLTVERASRTMSE